MVDFLYTSILGKCVSTYFVKIGITKFIQGVVAEGAKVLGYICFFSFFGDMSLLKVILPHSNLGKKCKDRFRGKMLLAKRALRRAKLFMHQLLPQYSMSSTFCQDKATSSECPWGHSLDPKTRPAKPDVLGDVWSDTFDKACIVRLKLIWGGFVNFEIRKPPTLHLLTILCKVELHKQ